MIKFILHIGRHKTGTTSIQETLSRNRAALADQGIDYPLFRTDAVAQHKIATHLTNSTYHHFDDQAAAFAYYKEYIAARANSNSGRVAIFSSEAFQYCDPTFVAQVFPIGSTQVVAYVRDQASYAISSYCQGVRTEKITQPVDDYARAFHVDYFDFASRWRDVFGEENVEFRVFDTSSLYEHNVVADFFHAIRNDGALNRIASFSDENASIGGPLVEINRLLNTSQLDKKELLARTYSLFSALARSHKIFRAKPCLSPEIYQDVVERHRKTNERFFQSILRRSTPFRQSEQCHEVRTVSDQEIAEAIKQCSSEHDAFRDVVLELLPSCRPLELIGHNFFDAAALVQAHDSPGQFQRMSELEDVRLAAHPPLYSFDGERFVPGYRDGSIELEHVHRYFLAVQLARGRRVLDIACGEGYGSDLLAQVASSVIGVDSDVRVIDAANQTYRRDNLTFRCASVFSIPAEDASFDLVACFETIEHVAEHRKIVAELKRVMTADGLLLLSSPNKGKYRANDRPNEHHILEITGAELRQLLLERFAYVALYRQEMVFGSLLLPPIGKRQEPQEMDVLRLDPDTGRLVSAPPGADIDEYFIALASDRDLPELPASIYSGDYPPKPISAVAGGIASRDRTIASLRDQLGAPQKTTRTEVRIDTRENDILLQDIAEKAATIRAMRELVQANSAERPANEGAAPLYVPPGHFYSPVVNPHKVVDYVAARRSAKRTAGVEIHLDRQIAFWSELKPYFGDVPFGPNPTADCRYGLENPHFSYADGLVLQAILRRFRPQRLIEVGSGYSSACALDTIEHFLSWRTQCTFVEPYPELLKSLLKPGDEDRIRIVPVPLQEASLDVFAQLADGDILFVDSTHVVKTGSDVCHGLFEILPSLARGVIVHFHDVFYPFEYPDRWIFRDNRSWNELYALRAFLMYNSEFEILFFSDFFIQHCLDLVERDLPMFLRNGGGSLWLRRR